jgi:hypothetical protein
MSKTNRREFLMHAAPLVAIPFVLPILSEAIAANPPALIPDPQQFEWRFCDKCHSLFYNGSTNKGRCQAGGGHNAQGYNFGLPNGNLPQTGTAQISWRFCDKCFVMFWDGIPDKGRCAAGGGHNAQGYNFRLTHDVAADANNQGDWRYCQKCHGMFYDGYPAKGSCPAGAGHVAQGFKFVLPFTQPRAAPPPAPIGGFRRVAIDPFSGVVALVNRVKVLSNPALPREVSVDFGPVIRQAWSVARTKLTQEALAFLNERDIGDGFRTSRNTLSLAENGDLYAGADGTGFTLRYVLRGNSIGTSIRIPGPSPSGTDPAFNVKFDVDVTMEVDKSGLTMSAGSARLRLNVSQPTGVNLVGKLAIAANKLVACLSGTDFIGQGLKAVNSADLALNKPVNYELGKMLGGRIGRGIAISPGYDKRYTRITLTLEDEGVGPVVH